MTENTQENNNKSEIPQTPFAFFWYVSKPFKWWMFGGFFFVILGSIVSQGSSYFFKLIVDAVEAGNNQGAFIYALLFPVAAFVGQMLFRVSGRMGRGWNVNVKKYSYDLLTKHTMKHSHSYFSDRFAGSLMSKMNNVVSTVDQLIPEILWTHLASIVQLIVTLVILALVDIKSAFVFLVLTYVLIAFNRRLSPKKTMYAKNSALTTTTLRGRIVDIMTNVQAVRQYVHTDFEDKEVSRLSTSMMDANDKNWKYTEFMLFWNGVILFIFSMAMFWFLVSAWQSGDVSTGELVLVLALYSQITGTLTFIGRAFNSTSRTIGEMEEGLEELFIPYEIIDTQGAKPLNIKQSQIDWKGVGFEFSGQPVFKDFDLTIQAGERMGLVGQSGAGKSTFVSLLLRQHDIQTGSIEIDGQDISKVTQDSLRENIAVVPQEPALFHRSIRENILYGKQDATEEELIEVAKKAQAYDFIMALPEGFETMVGERGVKLSGGQKQRVAIARAMLKDAPILVLDEATSALDSESEVAIQKALEVLMEGRTVIAIAHRLSTLRKMDRIIVMEEGQIIEDGDHDSLSTGGGVYERLWNHQAGGFLQE